VLYEVLQNRLLLLRVPVLLVRCQEQVEEEGCYLRTPTTLAPQQTSRSTLPSLKESRSTSSARTLSSASSARSQSTAGKSFFGYSITLERLNINTPSTPKSTTIIYAPSDVQLPIQRVVTGHATGQEPLTVVANPHWQPESTIILLGRYLQKYL
jgi:cytoskeletal protein RodZ